jgi:hypothetical protein
MSRRLLEAPNDRDALEALPGVGRKPANVVLNTAFGHPDHRGRHPRLPGREPHRSRPRQDAARRRARARGGGAQEIRPSRPPLADPARPLRVHSAPAPMCPQCVVRDLCAYPAKTSWSARSRQSRDWRAGRRHHRPIQFELAGQRLWHRRVRGPGGKTPRLGFARIPAEPGSVGFRRGLGLLGCRPWLGVRSDLRPACPPLHGVGAPPHATSPQDSVGFAPAIGDGSTAGLAAGRSRPGAACGDRPGARGSGR